LFGGAVYLTFDGAAGDATPRILDFLDENRLPALFFLPPDSLNGNPALVRRIAAQHQIGLLIENTPSPDDAILRGNALLRETAFMKTWLLRSENAPVDDMNYRNWGYSHRFSERDTASVIMRTVTPLLSGAAEPSVLVFSLPHTEAAADALAEMLTLIGREQFWRVNPGEFPVK
jgi:hypothetical protein